MPCAEVNLDPSGATHICQFVFQVCSELQVHVATLSHVSPDEDAGQQSSRDLLVDASLLLPGQLQVSESDVTLLPPACGSCRA